MKHHVLIVDDEPDIRNLVRSLLEPEGFTVSAAGTGREMRDLMQGTDVDLVVLDLGLPDQDGFTLTRELRRTSDVALIILTGKGDEVDKIVGLELGADDYVTKPFRPRELLARIKSVLRRVRGTDNIIPFKPAERPDARASVLTFQGWTLDLAARELRAPDGDMIHLTSAEFALLAALTTAPNEVLSRSHLLEKCSGREWSPYDRSIDIHIGRLRSKIEPDPKRPSFIKTIRGAGYVFTAPVEPVSKD